METPRDQMAVVSARLKWVREDVLGISTARMAELVSAKGARSVSGASVSRYENWNTQQRVPPADYITAVARLAPKVSVEYLLGMTDDPDRVKRGEAEMLLREVRLILATKPQAGAVRDLAERTSELARQQHETPDHPPRAKPSQQ